MTKLSRGIHVWFIWILFHALSQQIKTNQTNMKIKTILSSTLALGLVVVGVTACVSEKQEQANLAAQARVSRADAEKAALAQVPGGKVKEGELEKEKGKLIWSFDITTEGTTDISEVAVDAITGAVLSVDKESAADEAKEKKEKDDDDKK
jgi:uncharacterized membrane protein YkoI